MALPSGGAFAPYLLQHLKVVAAENAPETKITPTGFTKMMLENAPLLKLPEHEKLRIDEESGNLKSINLKYLQRINPSQIQSSDDCDLDSIPVYNSFTLQAPSVKKFSFLISDYTMALYENDAAKTVALGQPPTKMMQEFMTELMAVVNGMIGAIDKDLISQVTFGKNIVSGNSGLTPTTINIPLDITTNPLSGGLGALLAQFQQNEGVGMPLLAGGGLFNSLMWQKGFSGGALNGLNNDEALAMIKWYYDNYTQVATGSGGWGSNNLGVFSKGSIGFIDLNKYIGFRAGTKGIDTYFQIQLPVNAPQSDGTVDFITFDCQLRWNGCPAELPGAYSTTTINRAWQLIITKNYGLFQIPSDAYSTGDVLEGNNGALLYNITNL